MSLVFICQNCGASYAKWQGHCDQCQQWNTIIEEIATKPQKSKLKLSVTKLVWSAGRVQSLKANFQRFSTGITEFDRCLGSDGASATGMVQGEVVLIGGEPGIGKSTLLTQVVLNLARRLKAGQRVMYVCGEESPPQINLRLRRLLQSGEKLGDLALDYVLTTDADEIVALVKSQPPAILLVDSIQTLKTTDLLGQAGSLGQIKETAERITKAVKTLGIPTFFIGHVTKDGEIAGPKVLEHMVDAIFELSGERSGDLRFLRTLKNRFGATDEVGVFQMAETGMVEVTNPSEYFLQGSQTQVPGSSVVCILEGTRPLLTEVQALVVPSSLALPRRVGRGVDLSRVQVLAAVLAKHCGLPLGISDIFLSVVGGMKIQESGIDLGLAMALASSAAEKALPAQAVFIGEVGLMGEIRPVSAYKRRLKEAQRLGYTQIYAAQTHRSVLELLQELKLVNTRR